MMTKKPVRSVSPKQFILPVAALFLTAAAGYAAVQRYGAVPAVKPPFKPTLQETALFPLPPKSAKPKENLAECGPRDTLGEQYDCVGPRLRGVILNQVFVRVSHETADHPELCDRYQQHCQDPSQLTDDSRRGVEFWANRALQPRT